ncbi:MAG TPA: recombination mediator RecR [Gemmataceae bacterium]|nr:recombination mediator RecR [Gemmataceae bacterium]
MGTEGLGAIAKLTEELGKLPGIGPKTAERLTHFLLAAPRADVLALADALRAIKEQIRRCSQCCNLTEGERCALCADPRRDASLVCVVEQPRDLGALERAGTYRGLYHVLHGRLAPLENVGPERLTIDRLQRRVQAGGVKEVIMATNPTLEGDGTALYLASLLAPYGVRVTRLARGLASGSVLEFANSQMLADALEGRRAF